jgi:hypothetical protein
MSATLEQQMNIWNDISSLIERQCKPQNDVQEFLSEIRKPKRIDISIFEDNQPDWWAQFDSQSEFFSFMNTTFPGFVLEKSFEHKVHYKCGDVLIVAIGI